MDCTNLFTFEPNHDVIAFGDYMGLEDQLDYRGRWYAGGEFLMIRYVSEETSQFIVLRIQEITPNAIRVLWDGKEMRLRRSQRRPPLVSNHTTGATRVA